MTLVVHEYKRDNVCFLPPVHKKDIQEGLGRYTCTVPPLRELLPEREQDAAKCHRSPTAFHYVCSKTRVGTGRACVCRQQGERPGSCVKAIFLHPRNPNRRLFLILYSWSGQPVFPPPFAIAQKATHLHTRTHTEIHTHAQAHDKVCPALSCPVLPHVDYCRSSPRSTRTSAPTQHTPEKRPLSTSPSYYSPFAHSRKKSI